MELILWRHADAEDPGPKGDLARELTKKGRKQAEKMAEWLRPRLEGRWLVLSSPATRAVQTVTALDFDYEVRPGLDPGRGPRDVLREAGWPGAGKVIVVGHNPTLAEIATELLGGREEVAFRKGAVWWFATRERQGRGEACLKVVMTPEMLD